MRKITVVLAFVLICSFVNAQTAEEIIDNYIENIGGADAFNALDGIQINALVNTPGGEFPIKIISLKGGEQYVSIEVQGLEIVQVAFDGESAWSHNMQSMQAEAMESEQTENLKRESKSFPIDLLDYKDKGFSIEKMENETVEGTDCFKIKLTKTPQLVDGSEVENVVIYFFDTENFVPIAQETEIMAGPQKGAVQIITFSDYQEVDGLYFAFSLTQGIKGMGSAAINVESVQLNPEIDKSIFALPAK